MKNLFQYAVLLTILAFSTNVFADVKIKTRRTMSGQSYENTTFIKGKRQRTEQNMGGMQTVNITQCDLKRNLQIMPVAQTYYGQHLGAKSDGEDIITPLIEQSAQAIIDAAKK